jgi:hypothetical protein
MKVMLVDGTNHYIKNYIVDPTISRNSGQPIGGIIGMLKTIQGLVNKYKPDRLYVSGMEKVHRRKERDEFSYKEGRASNSLE